MFKVGVVTTSDGSQFILIVYHPLAKMGDLTSHNNHNLMRL